jgi:type II secretory pathway component GspD/PulD (secretin)
LAAVIQASKTDSRTKYVASPIVMTVDNKEASIEATASRQFLTGWSAVSGSYAGSGLPSPNYTAKDIGITLKIEPKINPNGTVVLNVEEEYSQVSGKQTMLTPIGDSYGTQEIDVPVTRKMTADISLENGQSVILGGLTTKTVIENEAGIPILKDIPWIGKWLFGSVEQDDQRSELLVFMTPYVLDDADAAKAEALRRKKTMSDPTPWEDGGWSASDLADPVSQKEQLRRLKDEWKKQDAERKTRQAIEQEKLNRAKKLKELSKEEREVWLKMHKEELEEEQQEELEKKMLDKDSQEGLKKLVEEIKKDKLGSAQKEIDKAGEMTRAENERARLDKAKAEKAKEPVK